jgi:hypothetical protein
VPETEIITVVSGLPRSGTSMMMRMLEAAGLPILTDGLRAADEDNPRGYYEFERVKKLESDAAWLPEARGRVVKIVSPLLKHLPPGHRYRVVFMRRRMDEVLASQRQMLVRRGRAEDGDPAAMGEVFRRHLERVEDWLERQPHVDVLYVGYNALIAGDGGDLERLKTFLGGDLQIERMTEVIERTLHRQRTG